MKNFLKRVFIILIVLSLGIFSLGAYEMGETLSIQGKNRVLLSIESYKAKDGLAPVILSIRGLDVLLWMRESGRVTEMRGDEFHPTRPVFTIDSATGEMIVGERSFPLTISLQNKVRTRMSLLNENVPITVKIEREKKRVSLYIGNEKLELRRIRAEFIEVERGTYEIRFRGPEVHMRGRLVYMESSGEIYSTHDRLGPIDVGKSRLWAKKLRKGEIR